MKIDTLMLILKKMKSSMDSGREKTAFIKTKRIYQERILQQSSLKTFLMIYHPGKCPGDG